ncbi:MAG: AAA family ATPase, partial [Anaerolineales bacterium]
MRHLWLLGPARVEQGQNLQKEAQENKTGAVPRFRSRRTVGLLGYLVSERRPAARDHLAALFWPDEEPSRGRANLSRELHNLSQILPDCWQMDRQSVTFCPAAGTTVDIDDLQQLEEQKRWGEAADLLGGEFLEGLYLDDTLEFESWLLGERERWRSRAEIILTRVITGYMRRGRYTDSLLYARRLLQFIPWHEATHARVMRLLAWTGQRGSALRQYERCRQTLWEELGVQPSDETSNLFHQIQAGKLDLPPQLPAFLTSEKARRKFEWKPFVGREDELAQLNTVMAGSLAGDGQVILITGGPGRGKTALLDAFARQAMENYPALLVAGGKCNAYSGLGDPYLPFREIMTMLTGDVEGRWDAGAISHDHAIRLWSAFPTVAQVLLECGPHLLDVLVPGASLLSRSVCIGEDDSSWLSRLRELVKRNWTNSIEVEQTHLFQQVANVLHNVARERPLLLILDDIQWADAASISLLFHLGRCLSDEDMRLLIACAYRPEEVALGRNGQRHPLAKVLNEFKRNFGDVCIDLGQVAITERDEGQRFVGALLDIEPNRLDETFRTALFQRTAGHPLFTIELLHAMQERGDLYKDGYGLWTVGSNLDWEMLPARVEAVIEERIDRLDSELRDILTIASVEGEKFTVQVVAEVRHMSERLVLNRLSQDLERRHRLVNEVEEVEIGQRRLSRYRFGHILFQDYLYKRLSQGERRFFHQDVAAVMEKLFDERLDEVAVELARHFYQAGNYWKSFHYFSLAGERADRLYESGEAISHYTRAIQLADNGSPDTFSLIEIHRKRGLAFEKLGKFDQAHNDHESVLKLAHTAREKQAKWRAYIDLGRLWASRDYDQAREYFEAALELAHRLNEPTLLGNSLNWMGNWHTNDENPQKAIAYHQEALNIFEDLGDRQALANTLDLLGIAHLMEGDIPASVRYYDRSIMLLREIDDRPRLVSSLIARAVNISIPTILVSV